MMPQNILFLSWWIIYLHVKKNPILKGSEKNIFLNLDTQELSQVPEASTW